MNDLTPPVIGLITLLWLAGSASLLIVPMSSRARIGLVVWLGALLMANAALREARGPILVVVGFAGIALFAYVMVFPKLVDTNPSTGHSWLSADVSLASLVAYFSSPAGGPGPMYHWLLDALGFSPAAAEAITIGFRKCVHFSYYGLIAGLAWAGAIRLTESRNRSIAFALLWTACFAAFDEVSQLASSNRTGSAWDVLLDLAGATAFVLIAARRRERSARPSASQE